jgi:hypothetical protein
VPLYEVKARAEPIGLVYLAGDQQAEGFRRFPVLQGSE